MVLLRESSSLTIPLLTDSPRHGDRRASASGHSTSLSSTCQGTEELNGRCRIPSSFVLTWHLLLSIGNASPAIASPPPGSGDDQGRDGQASIADSLSTSAASLGLHHPPRIKFELNIAASDSSPLSAQPASRLGIFRSFPAAPL
jgi:hypothetical protein